MSVARAELWAHAAALSAAAGDGLTVRARRLAVAGDPPLGLGDVRGAPDWIALRGAARGDFARLVGAAAVSHAWRRTIDGPTLRAAGDALGEAALDALLALPEVFAPRLDDAGAEAGDADALERLGGALLLGDDALPRRLKPRLARALAGGADAATKSSAYPAETAAAARRTAEAVQAQLSAGGVS